MYNKYHAQKTWMKGRVYDSKFESEKAFELQLRQRAGLIKDLQEQVPFVLQEGYVNNQGKKIRPITYIADFVYFDCEKQQKIVMDTKSPATRTDVYKIKKKLFEKRYQEYIFIEVCKKQYFQL